MLSRSAVALRSQRISPAGIRGYASEPVNAERGNSRAPFVIPVAIGVLVAGYLLGTKGTPNTPAVAAMKQATQPKTPAAREAAGAPESASDRPSQAGEGNHSEDKAARR